MSETALVAVLERVRAAGWPALSLSTGNIGAGDMAWSVAASRFGEAHVREVNAELDKLEQRAQRDRDEEEHREMLRHTEAVARGEEERTPEEEADFNQQRIEALAAQQQFESERPARVEALLERIANALEKR
jgi:hypothetical protein